MAVPRRLVPWLVLGAGLIAVLAVLLATGPARAQVTAPPDASLKQVAPGLLGRPIYTAEAPAAAYRVQVWELLVGPGRRSEPTTFPGALVLEVRSGSGAITIDDKRQDVKIGTTLAVHDGSRFAIENTDKEAALSLRGVVISAQK
jgi:hypothetical protein